METSRVTTRIQKGKKSLLSSEDIEKVIASLTALRGGAGDEFDSVSIDNAIALCEKVDLCFANLSDVEKHLLLQNYEFFASHIQFSNFIKALFHGGIASKEAIFRGFMKKLRASQEVITLILRTQTLFETPKQAEEVRFELTGMVESLLHSFAQVLPTELHPAEGESFSLSWLESLIKIDPLLRDGEKTYAEITRDFSDLLYTVFSHQSLPNYLEWRDSYLRYWMLHILRSEDQTADENAPKLSSLKADIYVNYIDWTKISRKLNSSLRQKDVYFNEKVIQAEAAVLERLPSDVLGQVVQNIRIQMKKGKAKEVSLGFNDAYVNEQSLLEEVVEEVLQEKAKRTGGVSNFFSGIVKAMKAFLPNIKQIPQQGTQGKQNNAEPKEVLITPRKHSEKLLETVLSDRMRFGIDFSRDYTNDIPKYYSLFFTAGKHNFIKDFETSVKTILDYYQKQGAILERTPQRYVVSGTTQPIEFEERYILFQCDSVHLLALGESYFHMKVEDHLKHTKPSAYFQWFVKSILPDTGGFAAPEGESDVVPVVDTTGQHGMGLDGEEMTITDDDTGGESSVEEAGIGLETEQVVFTEAETVTAKVDVDPRMIRLVESRESYELTELTELGGYRKDILENIYKAIDSLPDDVRNQASVQKMIKFLYFNTKD